MRYSKSGLRITHRSTSLAHIQSLMGSGQTRYHAPADFVSHKMSDGNPIKTNFALSSCQELLLGVRALPDSR